MTTTLTDKVALITGGSQGLGAAIAARDADVAISDVVSAEKAAAVVQASNGGVGRWLHDQRPGNLEEKT